MARAVTSPTAGVQVTCMSPEIDLHDSGGDACAGASCGDGTCVVVNDRPTCRCNEGTVAITDGVNPVVRCVERDGEVHDSDALLGPDPNVEEPGGCTSLSGERGGALAEPALVLGGVAGLRHVLHRRRRREPG